MSDPFVETEEEYEERANELIEDARRDKQELEREQNAALEDIAAGEDLERYATVELGDLEMEVKAWLPGDTTDTVQRAADLAESESLEEVKASMEVMLSALDDMTTADRYDMKFWREYYSRFGPKGLMVAAETVLEPASEEIDSKREAVKSFRNHEQG